MATPHGTSTKAGAQENPLLLGELDDVADRQQAASQEVGHHGAPDLWSLLVLGVIIPRTKPGNFTVCETMADL